MAAGDKFTFNQAGATLQGIFTKIIAWLTGTKIELTSGSAFRFGSDVIAEVNGTNHSLAGKQNALVSGSNIITINGESILRGANINLPTASQISGILGGNADVMTTTYDVTVELNDRNNEAYSNFEIPSATTSKAGIMSAIDKQRLDMLKSSYDSSAEDSVFSVSTSSDKVNLALENIPIVNPDDLSVNIPSATTSKAGVMSAEDKQKLDALESDISQLRIDVNSINSRIEAIITHLNIKTGDSVKTYEFELYANENCTIRPVYDENVKYSSLYLRTNIDITESIERYNLDINYASGRSFAIMLQGANNETYFLYQGSPNSNGYSAGTVFKLDVNGEEPLPLPDSNIVFGVTQIH